MKTRRVLTLLTGVALVSFGCHSSNRRTPVDVDVIGDPAGGDGLGGDADPPLPPEQARVFRDEHGVAHIEAGSEPAAWYALGYEEARDALFHIQVNVKAYRGQATLYHPPTASTVLNDLIVRAMRTHRGRLSEAELRAMLRLEASATGNPEQFYDNLVAWTAGVNAYREKLLASDVPADELDQKTWLEGLGYTWALTDPVTVADVASWGIWTRALLNWGRAAGGERNPVRVDLRPRLKSGAPAEPAGELWAPAGLPGLEEPQQRAGHPAVGSNSYCWSYDYMEVDGVPHTGMVGDPHQTVRTWVRPADGGINYADLAHVTFVHLKVPNTADPNRDLDAFGYVQHATGALFLQHNFNVAIGGSAGPPNNADAVLLRLKAAGDGTPELPLRYYSYYADTDGDDGADETDWVPFVSETLTIEAPAAWESFSHTILRAGPFGVVFNPTPFYAAGSARFTGRGGVFDDEPGVGTIPVLVAYRIPLDDDVDGAAHNARLQVGMYNVMHARDLHDVVAEMRNLNWAFQVQLDAVDRWGRLFTVTSGAVPRRGDDAALRAAGYVAFPDGLHPDKWALYTGDPVPVRNKADQMFDWVFTTPGDPESGLRYLIPEGDGGEDDPDYLPYVLYDPVAGVYNPPRQVSGADPELFENPGFLSSTNDVTYDAYRKRTIYRLKATTYGNPLNTIETPNNAVAMQMLEAGTTYHMTVLPIPIEGATDFVTEGHQRTKYTIDFLSDIARGNLQLPGGTPKMDLAGALGFAQDTRLYHERSYQGPTFTGAPAHLVALPPQVRVIAEAHAALDGAGGILAEYARELAFWQDLWAALFTPLPGTSWQSYEVEPGVELNLKDTWVDNAYGSVFVYPGGVAGTPTLIPMPAFFGLIDFHWLYSLPGVLEGDTLTAFTEEERARLPGLVDLLVNWDTPATPAAARYRNRSDSVAAALLGEFHLGLDAARYDAAVSRPWLPLLNGLVVGDTLPDSACPTDPELVALDANGMPPALEQGLLPSGRAPHQLWRGYTDFRDAGRVDQAAAEYGSWLGATPYHHAIARFVAEPPYAALYSDVDGRVVRDTLGPAEINAFVDFFMTLGGFKVTLASGEVVWAKSLLLGDPEVNDCPGSLPRADAIAARYRAGYPLTRTMARVLLLRRLLTTAATLEGWFGELPTFGEVFRTRAFDYRGVQRWPLDGGGAADPAGLPMEGWGTMRSASMCLPEDGATLADGFQRRVFCVGGSARPIFTFFPKDQPSAPPKSFYWNAPGQRVGRFDSVHFADHLEAFRTNVPLPSHLTDYRAHPSPEYASPVDHVYGE